MSKHNQGLPLPNKARQISDFPNGRGNGDLSSSNTNVNDVDSVNLLKLSINVSHKVCTYVTVSDIICGYIVLVRSIPLFSEET